ncbi:hypothetical protein EYZ11_012744 [Aspergillus tanneri]|uniref:Uncharacterized protein n=1 Tax=Aspergillus tanneri TaxID=1220188 RepID=A0A4S3IZG1_9EURO|nr:uncharacterized protein ATNIH1004_011663 [Aspergillus tanneri]KAA8641527.1 hypothetical protein ATNIH1004_011663 [Aspergillus tanneri]THC87810.1 hypothetical protein EYZ11_012744 [Aspergillus tanneri]
MDEAADPLIPYLFRNKIPANFMGSRAWASDQPDIQSQLLPGQDVTVIPAVVCRVFRARLGGLKAFKDYIGLVPPHVTSSYARRFVPARLQ